MEGWHDVIKQVEASADRVSPSSCTTCTFATCHQPKLAVSSGQKQEASKIPQIEPLGHVPWRPLETRMRAAEVGLHNLHSWPYTAHRGLPLQPAINPPRPGIAGAAGTQHQALEHWAPKAGSVRDPGICFHLHPLQAQAPLLEKAPRALQGQQPVTSFLRHMVYIFGTLHSTPWYSPLSFPHEGIITPTKP